MPPYKLKRLGEIYRANPGISTRDANELMRSSFTFQVGSGLLGSNAKAWKAPCANETYSVS